MLLTFKYLIKEKLANEDYEIVKEEEIKKQEGNKKNELCEEHQKEIEELKTQIEQKSQMILEFKIELKKLNEKSEKDLQEIQIKNSKLNENEQNISSLKKITDNQMLKLKILSSENEILKNRVRSLIISMKKN